MFDRDDLAGDVRVARHHHVEAVVEHDLGPALQGDVIDVGMQGDAHLAAAGQHVDRAVVVLAHHRAVRGRRLGQLLDLFPE